MHYRIMGFIAGGFKRFFRELLQLIKPDAFSLICVAGFLIIYAFSIARHSSDAVVLATFFDDEALISMQLDGMATWPFGDPSNYLGPKGAPGMLPNHWYNINYHNLPYYGGLFLDISLLIWAPLKLIGFSTFPAVPVILRILTLLASSLLALSIYNLARRNLNTISAQLGLLYILTDQYFNSHGTLIHPDTFMLFLCVVGISLAIAHVRERGTATLIALGIAAGLAQGAKMGGPLLVPAVALAVTWALAAETSIRSFRFVANVVLQGAIVIIVAIVIFFMTTPYALFNPYYFTTWAHWAKQFSGTSPISPTTFGDWAAATGDYVGPATLVLALVGAVLASARRDLRLAAIMIFGTGAWNFLYYAAFQKYWVQPQYLILFYGLVGVAAAYGISIFFSSTAARYGRWVAGIGAAVAALVVLALPLNRLNAAVSVSIRYMLWRELPHYRIGTLAVKRGLIPNGSRIMTDTPSYFDPARFPDLVQNGGPVRYVDLARELPDFFVLTRFGSWHAAKITGPAEDPWAESYANLRFYQQLLGRGAKTIEFGTEPVSFAQPLLSFGWTQLENDAVDWRAYPVLNALHTIPFVGSWLDEKAAALKSGRNVALFSLDKNAFIAQIPQDKIVRTARAIASSSTQDSNPASIILGGSAWRSAKVGTAAEGEYAGLSFPAPVTVSRIGIRWIAPHWLPSRIAIDHADEAGQWVTSGEFTVSKPEAAEGRNHGANRWEETFELPKPASHRYWRIRALEMPPSNFFGLEQIRIDP